MADISHLTSLLIMNRQGRAEPLMPPLNALPQSRAASYAIRDKTIRLLGEPTCGWKIGAVGLDVQKAEGYDGPIPGRILVNSVFKSGTQVQIPAEGLGKIEVELAVRLKTRVKDFERGDFGCLTTLGELADILIAFDVTASRYAADWMLSIDPQQRMLAQLADNGNGGLVVVGPSLDPTAVSEARSFKTEMFINDKLCAASTRQVSILEHLLPSLNWIIEHTKEYQLPLAAGDLILTGALAKPLALARGDRAKGLFYCGERCAMLSTSLAKKT